MTPNPRDNAALMMVLAATLGLAFKGIFAKLALAAGLSVAALVTLRLVWAWPLFWAGAAWRGEGNLFGLGWREVRNCVGAGMLFLLATISDFTAIDRLGAGLSRIVLFTFPLFVVLINAALERQRPSARHLTAFAVSYAGLLVVLAPGHLSLDRQFLGGIGWSFISALSYATYLVVGQRIMRRIGSARFTFAANTASLLGVLIFASLTLDWTDFTLTLPATGWLLAIVVISTVVPIFLLYEGIRRIGAGRASLISLGGPVLTMLVAWAVLGETISLTQSLGFVLVLIGVGILEGLIGFPKRVPML
ncbi:DMT family transporter [Magnetospira thiophila]